MLRRSAVATLAISALVLADPGPSPAATWDSRQVPVGTKDGDALLAVACPSASACVATGNRGALVTSTNPVGGAGAWRSGVVARGPYAGTSAGQQDRTSPGALDAVSCPSVRFCAAVSFAGDLYASGDPLVGATTWRATDLDGDGLDTHLTGVSCPDASFCVAVAAGTPGSGAGGTVIAIREPLAPVPVATQTQLDGSLNLRSISCPTTSFCVAVADRGRVVASGNPAAPSPAWKEVGVPVPGDLEAVLCPDPGLCFAGNSGGNILDSADPLGGAGSWSVASAGVSVQITGISCASRMLCAASDNNGDAIVSTRPSGPTGSWSATSLIPYPIGGGRPDNALFGISCPSAGLCAAVGSAGLIFTSENPFDPGGSGDVGGRRRDPKRPRLRIIRSDNFSKQTHTKRAGSRVTFRLRPFGRARGFVCSLDRRRFRPCRTPLRIYAKVGRHLLSARAIGATGLRGPVTRLRFEIEHARG